MKTYKQAIKTPKNGWKYADNESMCAAMASNIALLCCLNPEAVYAWIRKHYGDNYLVVKNLRKDGDMPYFHLVEYILNDEPAH